MFAVTSTAVLLATPCAPAAWADPTPPGVSGPSTGPAAPTAPASPPGGSTDPSDGRNEIQFGTANQGQIHWEKFGGSDTTSPKNLDEFSTQIVGYALTGFGIAAVLGSLVVFGLMIVGVKGRSTIAKNALESSIWIWAGCMLVGSASTIGGMLLTAGIPD
ncbi:hypothetical protein [Williamsia sp. CHRR-6]|uniref:hypothetical protein n=1 Tax=Williamsia sp. CHRR-6 TaxID=2835871 RepID=UPI001BD93444|nr:hypothetical protein [Williamsia sp. CHRR-6]MBT0568622.1 hypothetical protein [Williamsia sp. CHRR-6]